MIRIHTATAALAFILALCVVRPASAQYNNCSSPSVPDAVWCHDTGKDLSHPSGLSNTEIERAWVQGNDTLLTYDSSTGEPLSTSDPVGVATGAPIPVEFSDTQNLAVFVPTNDGYIVRVDPNTGDCVWKTFIGRTTATDVTPGCAGTVTPQCSNDVSDGTPTVWVRSLEADSMVIVGTHYGVGGGGACGAGNRNRVYALNAVTGDPVWVFNQPSAGGYANSPTPYALGYVSNAVYPDVYEDGCGESTQRNLLYFGTNRLGGPTNPSLWALNAYTGTLAWNRGNLGTIETMPILSYYSPNCERLYVATSTTNSIAAVGITTTACGGSYPCVLWSSNTAQPVSFNISAIHSGPHAGKIIYTAGNEIRVVEDTGSAGVDYCAFGPNDGSTSAVTTRSYVHQSAGRVYVGLNDGTLVQLELDQPTGGVCTLSGTRTLATSIPVENAFMDFETGVGPFLTVTNEAGRFARFNVPW